MVDVRHLMKQAISPDLVAKAPGLLSRGWNAIARPALTAAAPAPAATMAGRAWNRAGNAALTAGGGMVGNMTADEMAHGSMLGGSFRLGGTEHVDPNTGKSETRGGMNINPLGIAAGVVMGNRGLRNTQFGQTIRQPAQRAMYGTGAGAGVDQLAGLAGVNTDSRFAQLGGLGGLATGLGSNRLANIRPDVINRAQQQMALVQPGGGALRRQIADQTRASLGGSTAGQLDRAGRVIDQTWQGAIDPIVGGARRAKQWFTGVKTPAAAMPTNPTMHAARRFGQAAFAIPATVGAAGMGYSALTGRMNNAVNQKLVETYGPLREQAFGDLDRYLQHRGMLNQQGQFDPTQNMGNHLGQALNPLLQMFGHSNPGGMSNMQRAAGVGGPMLAAGGGMSGNPLMTLAGMGLTAAPHFMRGTQGTHAPGMYDMSGGGSNQPQVRNELEAQRSQQLLARADAHTTGQGYL